MPETDRPALGILAGGGNLPGRVAAAAQAAGRMVFIVGLEGYAEPEVIAPYPHATAQLGAAGRILALLRERNCHDLVLIGPVRRPSILDIRPDVEGTRLLATGGAGGVRRRRRLAGRDPSRAGRGGVSRAGRA